jgi:ATP-binding cassette subfamily B protein
MGLDASLASARVSLKRVSEILDARVDVVESPAAVALPSVRGRMTLEHATYAFGRGGPVLDGVSLDVSPGERVAIVGRSGEGKSTIADLLVRQLDPDNGRVLPDGVDLRAARLADVRRHVLVVDQDPFVSAPRSPRTFGTRGLRRPMRRSAPRGCGRLGTLLARSPRGLDTSAGERGAHSAGNATAHISRGHFSPILPYWCSMRRQARSTRRPGTGCCRL